MDRVVEYDKDFKEMWSYDIPKPWAAIRLKNGNTLITDEHDVSTREVEPTRRNGVEVKPTDLPEPYRYGNTQSATRLANGNTIICSRGGRQRPATGGGHAGQERSSGSCRIGSTSARRQRCKFSMIPAFRNTLAIRNTNERQRREQDSSSNTPQGPGALLK